MTTACRRGTRRGFTLLETAVVLALTAIGALLVLPTWSADVEDGTVIREAFGAKPEAALEAFLHEARRQAIAARQVVTVRIDREHGQLRIDTAAANGAGIWRWGRLTAAASWPKGTEAPAVITFHPSGAAQGEPLALRDTGGDFLLRVDPWSGEVHRVVR